MTQEQIEKHLQCYYVLIKAAEVHAAFVAEYAKGKLKGHMLDAEKKNSKVCGCVEKNIPPQHKEEAMEAVYQVLETTYKIMNI